LKQSVFFFIIVNKNILLHRDDTQLSICVSEKKRLREEKKKKKRGKKVSYFNFVVFSHSARMPTTTRKVHALPHLIVVSINFESSMIVYMHIFSFFDLLFFLLLRLCILNKS
jgi:hypothetical protein